MSYDISPPAQCYTDGSDLQVVAQVHLWYPRDGNEIFPAGKYRRYKLSVCMMFGATMYENFVTAFSFYSWHYVGDVLPTYVFLHRPTTVLPLSRRVH